MNSLLTSTSAPIAPTAPSTTPGGTGSPLDQLADIHLPDPVSLWPLAPGWYLLLVLALLVALGAYGYYRRQRNRRYRRAALAELQQAYSSYQHSHNTPAYLQVLNQILRRTALSAGAPAAALSLGGADWLHWLDHSATKLPGRFSDHLDLLVHGPYRPQPVTGQQQPATEGLSQVHRLAQAWIRQHQAARFTIHQALAAKAQPATVQPAAKGTAHV